MARSFTQGEGPGWRVAQNLRDTLSREFPKHKFSVMADYNPSDREEAYHIRVLHPRTNELRLYKRMTLRQLQDEDELKLFYSQLWLVEPPPT